MVTQSWSSADIWLFATLFLCAFGGWKLCIHEPLLLPNNLLRDGRAGLRGRAIRIPSSSPTSEKFRPTTPDLTALRGPCVNATADVRQERLTYVKQKNAPIHRKRHVIDPEYTNSKWDEEDAADHVRRNYWKWQQDTDTLGKYMMMYYMGHLWGGKVHPSPKHCENSKLWQTRFMNDYTNKTLGMALQCCQSEDIFEAAMGDPIAGRDNADTYGRTKMLRCTPRPFFNEACDLAIDLIRAAVQI